MLSKPGANTAASQAGVQIHRLGSDDKIYLSQDNDHGVRIRDIVGDRDGQSNLPPELLVTLALNEAGLKNGCGRIFCIPPGTIRASTDGFTGNGPNMVYVPWRWSQDDPYCVADQLTRLRMSAYERLQGETLVLGIFAHYRSENNAPTMLPGKQTSNDPSFRPGTATVFLLFDDFPSIAWREQYDYDLTLDMPKISQQSRRTYKKGSLEEVMEQLREMWDSPFYPPPATEPLPGDVKVATVEEVFADSLEEEQREEVLRYAKFNG